MLDMRGETDGDGEEMLGIESLRASVQWVGLIKD